MDWRAERARLTLEATLANDAQLAAQLREANIARLELLLACDAGAADHREMRALVTERARRDPVWFISALVYTFDPRLPARGMPAQVPLTLRPRQLQFIHWLLERRRTRTPGLVIKARDEGMTVVLTAYYLHCWLFEKGFKGGVGSRKLDLVDQNGNPDSLFEKLRMMLRALPAWLHPEGFAWNEHSKLGLLINPATSGSITGEGGDNIGRGGRSSIYFVDEAAYVQRMQAVHAALGQNSDVLIYGSTPNGMGNLYAELAHDGTWPVFEFPWRENPAKNFTVDVPTEDGGTETVYPWYEAQKARYRDAVVLAQEVDMDFAGSAVGALIEARWIRAAREWKPAQVGGRRQSGLDVADGGNDRTVYCHRQGAVVLRITGLHGTKLDDEVHNLCELDTPEVLAYDKLGVGAAISATLGKRAGLPYALQPVANSHKPTTTVYDDSDVIAAQRFANYGAECAWRLRLRFENTYRLHVLGEDIDEDECISLAWLPQQPDTSLLIRQLSQPRVERAGTSDKIRIDKKGEAGSSPDFFESLMYAFAPERAPAKVDARPAVMHGWSGYVG